MPLHPVVWTSSHAYSITVNAASQRDTILSVPSGLLTDPTGGTLIFAKIDLDSPTLSPAGTIGVHISSSGLDIFTSNTGISSFSGTVRPTLLQLLGGNLTLSGDTVTVVTVNLNSGVDIFLLQNSFIFSGLGTTFSGLIVAALIDTPGPGVSAGFRLSGSGSIESGGPGTIGNASGNISLASQANFAYESLYIVGANFTTGTGGASSTANTGPWADVVTGTSGKFSLAIGSYDASSFPAGSYAYNFTTPAGSGSVSYFTESRFSYSQPSSFVRLVYPFVWVNLGTYNISLTPNAPFSIDVLPVPAGIAFANNPMLVVQSGLTFLSQLTSAAQLWFRFPDSSVIPIGLHNGGGILRYETVNSRLIEGGTIFITGTANGTASTALFSNQYLLAALVDIQGITLADFEPTHLPADQTFSLVTTSSPTLTTSFQLASVAEPFSNFSYVMYDMFGVRIFDANADTEPWPVVSVPTFTGGSATGVWYDIAFFSFANGYKEAGIGMYVASAANLSRSFNITNLQVMDSTWAPPLTGRISTDLQTTVLIPQPHGGAYGKIVGA